jgi:anti-sigma factor RsiW
VFNCKEIVDVCLEFLDGTLPSEERSQFESHLGACSECMCFFETYRRTPQISREAFAMQMPASVKEAVRAFLRSRCCR